MTVAVLADAGPLYAAVDEADQHHLDARQELQTLNRDRCNVVIAYPILLEAYSLVLQRLGVGAALQWMSFLAGTSFINPDAEDYRRAATLVRDFPDQRISLVDATVAVLALRFGLDVWTYDHHFDVMRVPVWR